MFRNFTQGNRGQNTAEYALLIALVVAGVIAMQTYTQRSLQAKMRDAGQYLTKGKATAIPDVTATDQYEPYYQKSGYSVTKDTAENKRLGQGTVAQDTTSNRSRSGEQSSTYDSTVGH